MTIRQLTTLVLLALGMNTNLSFAQSTDLRAVTEDGRKVLLSPNGKWRFDPNVRSQSLTPSAPESTSPYQTTVKRFSLAFNPTEWNLMPKREGDPINKRMLQHKTLPIYAMVMADEMPASTEALKDVIFYNANTAGASTTVLIDKTRKLGDQKIGELRMTAIMKGLEFVFSTYYYADDDGNIQVMCYTAQSLYHKYQADCEKLLNGLTIKP